MRAMRPNPPASDDSHVTRSLAKTFLALSYPLRLAAHATDHPTPATRTARVALIHVGPSQGAEETAA